METKYAREGQRIHQLLEHEELGDRKPSQFLRHLRTLAGTNISEQLLRTLWLERLPSQMQVILATKIEDRLKDVAEQADCIAEVTSRNMVTTATAPASSSLEDQIKTLTQQLAKLTQQVKGQFSLRSRSRNRVVRERPQSRNRIDDGQRFYHRRFKSNVKNRERPVGVEHIPTLHSKQYNY
ncbi:uncharacterized protein [Polyergus mexicanus]|uniref:uncharacterized protein n=1 Tax=Polyergus mexicanus TaxID=615972 RepID=UPI0038B4C176